MYCLVIKLSQILVPRISSPAPTQILSVRVHPPLDGELEDRLSLSSKVKGRSISGSHVVQMYSEVQRASCPISAAAGGGPGGGGLPWCIVAGNVKFTTHLHYVGGYKVVELHTPFQRNSPTSATETQSLPALCMYVRPLLIY